MNRPLPILCSACAAALAALALPLATWAEGPVQTSVNPSAGTYQESVVDLNVMIQGGRFDVERQYQGGAWSFDLLSQPTQIVVMSAYYESGLGASDRRAAVEVKANGFLHQGSGHLDGAGAVTSGVFFSSGGDRLERSGEGWDWKLTDGRRVQFDPAGRLLTHQDAGGSVVRFGYDATTSRIAAVYDHWSNRVLWIQSASNGWPAWISDAATNGRAVTYQYDAADRLTNVTGVLGERIGYGYDAQGRITSIRWGQGRAKIISYHVDGTVASILDEAGRGDRFEYNYDASRGEYYLSRRRADGSIHEQWMDETFRVIRKAINGQLVTAGERDDAPLAAAPSVTFGENGYPTEIQLADGSWSRFAYAGSPSRLVQEWSSFGVTNTYGYDAKGYATNLAIAVAPGSVRRTSQQRDGLGHVVALSVEGDGSAAPLAVHLDYDAQGNVSRVQAGDHRGVELTYDQMGNLVRLVDLAGRTSEFTYDAVGRLQTRVAADGSSLYVARSGNRVAYSNEAGETLEIEYGRNDLPVRLWKQGNPSEVNTYDDLGRLVTTCDGETNLLQALDYDGFDRVVGVTYGGGGALSFGYDTNHPLSSAPIRMEAPNFSIEGTRNEGGQLTSMAVARGSNRVVAARFEYDSLGRVASSVNIHGLRSRYAYDYEDRLVAWSNELRGEVRYEWNVAGRLKRYRDATGYTLDYQYNAFGQETNVLENGDFHASTTYDAAGRVLQTRSASGRATDYAYDVDGELTQTVNHVSQVQPSDRHRLGGERDRGVSVIQQPTQREVVYENASATTRVYYDRNNRVTQEVQSVNGQTYALRFTYDKQGLLTSVSDQAGSGMQVVRAKNYQVGTLDFGSGSVEFSDYDAYGQPQTVVNGPLTIRQSEDALGEKSTRQVQNAAGTVLYSEQALLDAMGRPLRLTNDRGQEWVSLDGLGQPVLISAGGEQMVISRDKAGQLQASPAGEARSYNDKHQLIAQGATTYDYDPDGRLLRNNDTSGSKVYAYNEDGQLASVADANGNIIVSYTYDALGRRVSKTADGVTTKFVNMGSQVYAEWTEGTTESRRYILSPDQAQLPLVYVAGGRQYSVVTDTMGRVIKLVDRATMEVAWEAYYGADGEPRIVRATVDYPAYFPGRYYDAEVGLYWDPKAQNYYDPATQRYLTPAKGKGLPDGMSPYQDAELMTWYEQYRQRKPFLGPVGALFSFFASGPCLGVDLAQRIVSPVTEPVISAVAGDHQVGQVPQETPEDGYCAYFLSMNGIFTDEAGSAKLEEELYKMLEATHAVRPGGIQRFLNTTKINGTTGAGDFAQCGALEFGFSDKVASWMAKQMEMIVNQCRSKGRTAENCCIYLFAHSQGTAISKEAIKKLNAADREFVRYVGMEGQQTLAPQEAGYVRNFVNPDDLVTKFPYLSFRNILDRLCGRRKDLAIDIIRANIPFPDNHNPAIYGEQVVDTLKADKHFKCRCQQ